MRREGYSYSEISKIIGISRKHAWRIAKDIKFSKEGKGRYHREVKGIPARIKPQKKGLTSPKIRVIGHLLFDGSVWRNPKDYNSTIMYVNGSDELVKQFIDDVDEAYGLKPAFIEENVGYKRVIFRSKLMLEDLMNYFESYSTSNQNITVPTIIMNGKSKIKIEFLKAFFEDEGSISKEWRIMGDSKSKKIIYQVGTLLNEFGFKFRICKYREYTGHMYKLYLHKNKENLILFKKLGLFEKAYVTHGKNKGRKKLDVLKEAIKNHNK
ncbi:hypothetical protein GF386_01020 [Candidatus Pacearchaeota archaeon]|nr:hypothetical protein [Candidatus Pacearchaeota archaeon]MBD3282817.1 hypothetical protein [Candidatus Pacearchaeota archaeon]